MWLLSEPDNRKLTGKGNHSRAQQGGRAVPIPSTHHGEPVWMLARADLAPGPAAPAPDAPWHARPRPLLLFTCSAQLGAQQVRVPVTSGKRTLEKAITHPSPARPPGATWCPRFIPDSEVTGPSWRLGRRRGRPGLCQPCLADPGCSPPSLRHQLFPTAWLLPRAVHLAPAQGTSLQWPCSARKPWAPASAGLHAASSRGLLELRGPVRGRLSLLVACHVPTSPSHLVNPAAGACHLRRHRVGEGPCSLTLPAHGHTFRRCLGAAEAQEYLASRPLPVPGPAHLHLPKSPPLSRFCTTF